MKTEPIIISLGGSLIVPDEIDWVFLKRFRLLMLTLIQRRHRLVVVCGGGATSRKYYFAAKRLTSISTDDLDRIGIAATRLNAELVRSVFGKRAHPDVVVDPTKVPETRQPVICAGGWQPGRSTDFVAVQLARRFGARTVVNLTNVDYVYTRNPKKYPDAKPVPELTWSVYLRGVPKKWSPRLDSPFDPVASRFAKRESMTVKIVDGRNLVQVRRAIQGQSFRGSVISG